MYFSTDERIILFPPGPNPFWFLHIVQGIYYLLKDSIQALGDNKVTLS